VVTAQAHGAQDPDWVTAPHLDQVPSVPPHDTDVERPLGPGTHQQADPLAQSAVVQPNGITVELLEQERNQVREDAVRPLTGHNWIFQLDNGVGYIW
jgi:hypothetical protein